MGMPSGAAEFHRPILRNVQGRACKAFKTTMSLPRLRESVPGWHLLREHQSVIAIHRASQRAPCEAWCAAKPEECFRPRRAATTSDAFVLRYTFRNIG